MALSSSSSGCSCGGGVSSSSSSDDMATIDGADAGGNSENIPEGEISGGIPSTPLGHVSSSAGSQKYGNDDTSTSPFAFRNNRLEQPEDTRSFDSDTRFLRDYSGLPSLELLTRGPTTMTTTLEEKILGLRREAILVDEIIRLSRKFLDDRQTWIARMTDETQNLRRRVLLRTVGGLHRQLTRQSRRLRQTLTDISQSPSSLS